MTVTLERPTAELPRPERWTARLCRRLGRLCGLARGAHDARVPF